VTANFLGSPKASSANTVVDIGNDPEMQERYSKMLNDLDNASKNIAALEATITPMEKAKASGYLTLDKMKQLDKAKETLGTLKPAYEAMKETAETLEGQISKLGRGMINVRKTAHAGLKIVIGEETLILQVDHERVSFYVGNDGITFIPLVEQK
jgi:uncharacterized protein (DUF342 family)